MRSKQFRKSPCSSYPSSGAAASAAPSQGVGKLPDDSSTRLLNAKQAASQLQIGTRKLWELTNRGEIPSVRIGRRVLYDPRDLDQFIAASKQGGK
jgi:excisionase family DNA binding protein